MWYLLSPYRLLFRILGFEVSFKWQPTPVLLPRKSRGRRSLVQATVHGGRKELDMTERLHFLSFFLSYEEMCVK